MVDYGESNYESQEDVLIFEQQKIIEEKNDKLSDEYYKKKYDLCYQIKIEKIKFKLN